MSDLSRILTVKGVSLPLREWARRQGINYGTIKVRLNRLGWSPERAVMTPPDKRFRWGGRPRADVSRPTPKMTHHERSGQARVRWVAFGKEHSRYLGEWGSAAAREAYKRFAAEWHAGLCDAPAATGGDLTVGGLVLRRLAFAVREYQKAGKPTSEVRCQKTSLKVLNELYGSESARDFGPGKLKAVREAMVARGRGRRPINQSVSRIVAAFRWAAAEGWIPASVPAALRELPGLKAGKTPAPEHSRKRPVPDADLTAILPHLSPLPARRARLAAAVRVQRITGMRPCEVCALRPCDLDRTGDVWLYVVPDHASKNLHRGKVQRYWIGPKAQAELRPYLDGPEDQPAFRTSRDSYWLAVSLACKRAGVTRFSPHQLRHSLANEVARELGSLKAAADAIGDTPETAARHYVHVDPAERQKIEWARDRG